MLEVKLILCPIDFSEFSVRAYRHALSLAQHYRARLVAQHVVELWRYPSLGFAANAGLYEEFRESLLERGKEELQELVRNHALDGIQPELQVEQGTAADAILSFAEAQKADVIVMGSHGRRGYDRLMLGSVTDRVMRRAPCPVLTVCKPEYGFIAENDEGRRVHHLDRILFCTDFSEYAQRGLSYALSVTAEYGAELTLLHVLEHAPGSAEAAMAIARATERLEQMIPPRGRETCRIQTAVRIGKPYEQIIQLTVKARIDLVTMAVRGRGAMDLAVFGSTTYRVMQLGPCPVLAVHV